MDTAACTLTDKHCVPCEGGVEPLTKDASIPMLEETPGWHSVEDKKLEREFISKDFTSALQFINKVGEIAESEKHHPDIFLHNWNKVMITLSTHAIGGLSENDFILAAKINELAA